jgi:hypothetical protein
MNENQFQKARSRHRPGAKDCAGVSGVLTTTEADCVSVAERDSVETTPMKACRRGDRRTESEVSAATETLFLLRSMLADAARE